MREVPHRTLEADSYQQRHREAELRDQEVPTIWVLLLASRLGVQHLAYACYLARASAVDAYARGHFLHFPRGDAVVDHLGYCGGHCTIDPWVADEQVFGETAFAANFGYAQVDGAYAGLEFAFAVAVSLAAFGARLLLLGVHDLVYVWLVIMRMSSWMSAIPLSNLGISWFVDACCLKMSMCGHPFTSNFSNLRS